MNSSAKYDNELEGFQLSLAGDDLVVAKKENQILAKIPLRQFKSEIEKREKSSWDQLNLEEVISKYEGAIKVEASFSLREGTPYLYGADADGRRGKMMTDLEDISADDLDITKLEFRLIDENGDAVGGEEFFVELEDQDQSIAKYIAEDINSDLGSYC